MHVIAAMHTIATCRIKIVAMKNTCRFSMGENYSIVISSIHLRLAPNHTAHAFTFHLFEAKPQILRSGGAERAMLMNSMLSV